mmetsp:Transcript_29884/g.79529  ORF Transcript_29884/g.79529 Transcript_29884/m.79529 type:complete len:471 (-) Transcript_29884:131-1543(-)
MPQSDDEDTWPSWVFPDLQKFISDVTGAGFSHWDTVDATERDDQTEGRGQVIDSFRAERPDAELLRKAESYRTQFFIDNDVHPIPTSGVLLPFLCKPALCEPKLLVKRKAMDLKELCQQAELSGTSDGMFGRGLSALSLHDDDPDAEEPRTELPSESEREGPQHEEPCKEPSTPLRRVEVHFAGMTSDDSVQRVKEGTNEESPVRSSSRDKMLLDGMSHELGFSVLRELDLNSHILSSWKADRSEDDEHEIPSSSSLAKTVTIGGLEDTCLTRSHDTTSMHHNSEHTTTRNGGLKSFQSHIMGMHKDDDDEDLEDQAEKVTGTLYMCREIHPELFEQLMTVPEPCTNEVLYLQLCVRHSEAAQWSVLRSRNQALHAMDPDEHWRVEQLVGFLTSYPQKIATLTHMLEREAEKRGSVSVHHEQRCVKLWLFLEQFTHLNFLVRRRHFITPPITNVAQCDLPRRDSQDAIGK